MKIRLHLKIFIFIVIFIFTRQIKIYCVIMLFSIFHELGHMFTGILLGFKPSLLEIMPFGLSISFDSNSKNYNKKIRNGTLLTIKKMIIAISGPLTNLVFTLVFSIFSISFFGIERELVIYSNIVIGIFNLVPIYPLDGGRIIKNILHIIYGRKEAYEYTNIISNITISILTAIGSIAILYYKNVAILLIIGYLWLLVVRENRKYKNKKQLYEKLDNINRKEYKVSCKTI